MRTLLGVLVVLGCSVAVAAPRKVLVLPLDGSVDQATRARLNATVQRLAKKLPGNVTVADTTFDETAAAVGCDAATSSCAETVRATLAVDELVYGRATAIGSTTTVMVHRVRGGTPTKIASVNVAPTDEDAQTEAALAPAFDVAPSAMIIEQPVPPSPPRPSRLKGTVLTVAGGSALLVSLVMWNSVANAQDDIDDADPQDEDDFARLESTEDSAQRNAILGDVFFVAGVGLAAWGIYTLVTDRVQVAPVATASSVGLAIGGAW